MNYDVVVQRLAKEDFDEAFARVAQNAPQTADRWLSRFEESLRKLEH